MTLKTLPIFLAFLLMGVADAIGPLADAVGENYNLSAVVATLMPSAVFIAFAIFSIPGGWLAARIGKKKVLLLGLGLNTLAVAVPAFTTPPYALLLVCIFFLGVGTTFLQVAGNPIMRDVSPPGAYSRNLAMAQGFKGVGSVSATYLPVLVGAIGVLAAMGWRGAFPIFFGLMAIAFVLVALMRIDEVKADEPPGIGGSLALLKKPVFAFAVLGIFLYVGSEVCMGRFLQPTLEVFGVSKGTAKLLGPVMFFASLALGRIVAGSININPHAFFKLSALLGLAGCGLVMTGNQTLTLVGIVLGGLGFANIWPMLFSITVEEMPERANELSGLMCMAIAGGAVVPQVMAQMIDSEIAYSMAYVVPVVCFAYLLVLSLTSKPKAAA